MAGVGGDKDICGNLSQKQLLLIFIPTIFFLGLRSKVADTAGYYWAFSNLSDKFTILHLDSRAYGYAILQRFCKAYLFSAPEAWLTTLVVISLIPLTYILTKYSIDIRISLFVFFASTEFTFLLNGSRQFVAVCLCFYAFQYIVEEKPVKYYLWVFLAISFHATAIIMLPVYYIVRTRIWSMKMWLIVIVVAIVSIYSEQVFLVFNEKILVDSVYGHYAKDILILPGVKVARVLVHCMPPAISFFMRKKIAQLDIKYVNYCVNLSVLNALIFIFASTIGGNLTGRLAEYFTIYNLLLYPILIWKTFSSRSRKIVILGFVVFFMTFYIYQMEIRWHGLEYISQALGIYIYRR